MHTVTQHYIRGTTRPSEHARAMWSPVLYANYTTPVVEFTAAFLFYLLRWLAIRYHPNA